MIDLPMKFANAEHIKEINEAINIWNERPVLYSSLYNITHTQIVLSLLYYKFEEAILYKLLVFNTFNKDISKTQPMSKQFIVKNIQHLKLNLVIDNKNIDEDIKTYIRMFI